MTPVQHPAPLHHRARRQRRHRRNALDFEGEEEDENILEYDEDENEFFDEDGLPISNMYGDELYYDELDDDAYYDEVDGV